jgi:hypothetical protein
MPDSPDGYYLAAYCINATSPSRAEVEWIVVSKSIQGDWVDRDGNTILPFYTIAIDDPLPAIPEGWIEHLHIEADHYATNHPTPKVSLAEVLGITPRWTKIDRRI